MVGKIVAVLVLTGILGLFQNCSDVGFQESPNSTNQKLAALELEHGEEDMENVDEGGEPSAEQPVTEPVPAPEPTPRAGRGNSPHGFQEGTELVACILVDHGKSLKLGLIESELAGGTSVARSVCISRTACLDKVSEKFEVLGAYSRGYCKNNPNVVRLTDEEIDELLK